jgi:NADH dehydrogenase
MTNAQQPILIAGATGALGGVVARKLLAAGVPVRAVGRNPEKLATLAAAGAETMVVDLLDRAAVARACEGVGQVYSTVNNVMGRGASSPVRVDVRAHEVLCAAAREAGVGRFVYLSARDMRADNPVDFFRTKHAIDGVVRACGVPHVLIQPSAFMETWVGMLADGIRKDGTATLFGDGHTVGNYIAVDDVAEFSLRILMRPDVANETIEIGGPSNVSGEQLVVVIEAHLGVRASARGRICARQSRIRAVRIRGGAFPPFWTSSGGKWPFCGQRCGALGDSSICQANHSWPDSCGKSPGVSSLIRSERSSMSRQYDRRLFGRFSTSTAGSSSISLAPRGDYW